MAIRGEAPDRAPAYTPTIASDVASRILGRPAHTGGPELWYAEALAWCEGEEAWQAFDTQVTEDVIALHRVLDLDVIRLPWRIHIRPSAQLDDETFVCGDADSAQEIWRWDRDVRNFICTKRPQQRPEDWPALARAAAVQLDQRVAQAEADAGIADAALQTRVGTDMLVVSRGPGVSLGVTEPQLLAAALEPAAVSDLLDCQLQLALAQLDGLACRGHVAVLGGGDMADKNGPLYSPAMFRRFMLPRWQQIAVRARELGLHYVWRSDGNLWSVSDMLFTDLALPGFGEVDHDATMTAAAVRTRYPELAIWANLSGDILARGSAEEVYRHATSALVATGGRRYFHGCSNTVLPGTPVANVAAMMQARDDFDVDASTPA
jgi:uroporphyrinogen decarboxylase